MNRTSHFFALTISPPQRPERSSFLFVDDVCSIRKCLNKASSHYMLVPEFTLEDARLHYHGVVRVDDPIKWFKSVRKNLNKIGFVKTVPINGNKSHLGWLCYCYKNWHISKEALRIEAPVMYHRISRKKPLPVAKKRLTIYDYI